MTRVYPEGKEVKKNMEVRKKMMLAGIVVLALGTVSTGSVASSTDIGLNWLISTYEIDNVLLNALFAAMTMGDIALFSALIYASIASGALPAAAILAVGLGLV